MSETLKILATLKVNKTKVNWNKLSTDYEVEKLQQTGVGLYRVAIPPGAAEYVLMESGVEYLEWKDKRKPRTVYVDPQTGKFDIAYRAGWIKKTTYQYRQYGIESSATLRNVELWPGAGFNFKKLEEAIPGLKLIKNYNAAKGNIVVQFPSAAKTKLLRFPGVTRIKYWNKDRSRFVDENALPVDATTAWLNELINAAKNFDIDQYLGGGSSSGSTDQNDGQNSNDGQTSQGNQTEQSKKLVPVMEAPTESEQEANKRRIEQTKADSQKGSSSATKWLLRIGFGYVAFRALKRIIN